MIAGGGAGTGWAETATLPRRECPICLAPLPEARPPAGAKGYGSLATQPAAAAAAAAAGASAGAFCAACAGG
eukprot:SAG22_NODE_2172_length_2893_cov_54.990694_1_plen_71_part_10